jgi:hypothetical protein
MPSWGPDLVNKLILFYSSLENPPYVQGRGVRPMGGFSAIVSSATLYKDVSAMVLFMLFYVLFITILCINNHIEYKKK